MTKLMILHKMGYIEKYPEKCSPNINDELSGVFKKTFKFVFFSALFEISVIICVSL